MKELESPSDWFAAQLKASCDALIWAARQVSTERVYAVPPSLLGTWSAARLAFHILYYEREVALPSIKHWLGESYPTFENYDEAAAWGEGRDLEALLEEYGSVRAEEIDLMARFDEAQWEEARDTAWGNRTLYWVLSKTYQHGIEHQNGILKIALLWEHYEARSKGTGASGPVE